MIDSHIYNPEDTICAISTPYGTGGIAIARVSGPAALEIADSIWQGKSLTDVPSHTAHLGNITDPADNTVIDQAVATVFKAPNSFTGEDVVELGIHGSLWIQRQIIELLIRQGCRGALPGEFSRRAFASGKLDLAQTEAVADLIASSSRAAHRLAMSQMRGTFSKNIDNMRLQLIELASLVELELDFSEEDVEFASRKKLHQLATDIRQQLTSLANSYTAGNAIKNGIPLAIIGKTNAGKSSLLNALLDDDRAIVSNIHGTTRDVVEDTAEVGPYLVRFKDTAGLRNTSDPVEALGIERSRNEAAKAQIVLYVIDAAEKLDTPFIDDELRNVPSDNIIFVINKTDLQPDAENIKSRLQHKYPEAQIATAQAKNRQGIAQLKHTIEQKLNQRHSAQAQTEILVTNARHAASLRQAAQNLGQVIIGIENNISGDFIAQDLREATHHLAAITGAITTPDLLQTIFTHFCVGK